MRINFEYFLNSLPVMGKGLLGIFFVMAVIYLVISVLNRVTVKNTKKEN